MSHDSVAVHTDPESQTTTEVELENLVRKARSSNLEEKLSAVQAIGKLLSTVEDHPTDAISRTGVVPVLVSCLQSSSHSLLLQVLSTLQVLTFEQSLMVVRYGALPLLVQLFNSKDPLVCEQALCVLDNICHDNECFDDINVDGFIERLLFFVNDRTPTSLLRGVSRTLSHLCSIKSSFESICKKEDID
ncbi:Importin subunit alpha-3, partial [Geodia barretti]